VFWNLCESIEKKILNMTKPYEEKPTGCEVDFITYTEVFSKVLVDKNLSIPKNYIYKDNIVLIVNFY